MAKKQAEERASAQPSKGKKKGDGRDATTGRFVKGYKGGGRKELPPEIKEMCRALTPQAIEIAKKIMLDDDAKHSDRLRAVEIILDRGYGKPVQAVDLDAATIPQVVILGDVPD